MHKTFEVHLAKDKNCSLKDWKLEKNKDVQIGLMTRFCFKCNNCGYQTYIILEPTDDSSYMDINTIAVVVTIANGIGHTQLSEILAGINVHCLSDRTYTRYQNLVLIEFTKAAENVSKKQLKKKKCLLLKEVT